MGCILWLGRGLLIAHLHFHDLHLAICDSSAGSGSGVGFIGNGDIDQVKVMFTNIPSFTKVAEGTLETIHV